MDFIASNLLMPLGGMLAAVFVGWRIWPVIRAELEKNARIGVLNYSALLPVYCRRYSLQLWLIS